MIDKSLAILARLVKELDGVSFQDLEHRIAFQKKFYILQEISGVRLGYIFGWDVYGPYSKDLANNAKLYEEAKEEIDEFAAELVLTTATKEKTGAARRLMALPQGSDITENEWLELLCSLHYLADSQVATAAIAGDEDRIEQLTTELMEKKPHLEAYRELVPIAWQRIWSSGEVISATNVA